jgi:hypothetical protein
MLRLVSVRRLYGLRPSIELTGALGFSTFEAWRVDLNKNLKAMFDDHLAAVEAKHEKEKQLLQREIGKRDGKAPGSWLFYKRMLTSKFLAERARLEQLLYRATTPEPPSMTQCIIKQEDLIQFLNLDALEKNDIEYVTHQRELVLSRSQDRTEQIMKTPQLRDWLVQPASKELLIHGNSEPLPISPISFFCAILMQNLRSVGKFKSVAFFCGCRPYEEYGGGRTLIMSLLCQLLQQQSFDLSFIDHEIAYRMDCGDVEAFCYVFRRLVEQVRRTETVFCVIDGINFYECNGEQPLQEMADVLRFLLDLAEDEGLVYKIMVTSPSTTEDVRQAIRDENYLALPPQPKNSLSFSQERFERHLEERFEA